MDLRLRGGCSSSDILAGNGDGAVLLVGRYRHPRLTAQDRDIVDDRIRSARYLIELSGPSVSCERPSTLRDVSLQGHCRHAAPLFGFVDMN